MCFNHALPRYYSKTANSTEISVPARLGELPALLAAAEAEAARLAGADMSRLLLVVEELFVNTVVHGHRGDSSGRVRVTLGANGGSGIRLRYEDDAPPFDITHFEQNFRSTGAEGGLGIALVRGLCREVRYRRDGGCNVIDIVI